MLSALWIARKISVTFEAEKTVSWNSGMFHMGICGPGSWVGIATGYGLDGPGIDSRWRRDFPHLSRPALGPTQPASCTMGTGSFPGVKSGRGVTLTPHPYLVPWSRKSRAIPLLPLWAVRPVQSLSACTRVNFTCTSYGNYGNTQVFGLERDEGNRGVEKTT